MGVTFPILLVKVFEPVVSKIARAAGLLTLNAFYLEVCETNLEVFQKRKSFVALVAQNLNFEARTNEGACAQFTIRRAIFTATPDLIVVVTLCASDIRVVWVQSLVYYGERKARITALSAKLAASFAVLGFERFRS